MKLIAKYGPDIFYNGSMGDQLVDEIKAFNGIINKEDLRNYRFAGSTTRCYARNVRIIEARERERNGITRGELIAE